MSTTWFPGMTWKNGYADDTPWEIAVANPGYGQIYVCHRERGWERHLAGEEVGTWLRQLTTRALSTATDYAAFVELARETDALPAFIAIYEARLLLPSFQLAALLAAAGSDRFDRLVRDEDDDVPQAPLCARCDLGTHFTPGALPSAWCDQYGHTPFGMSDGSRWDTAVAIYESRYASWQRKQADRLEADRLRELREEGPRPA